MIINSLDDSNYVRHDDRALELYLDRLEPGIPVDIGALCKEHPDLEEPLIKVHERWANQGGSLKILGEGAPSFSERLNDYHGRRADPEISLNGKPRAAPDTGKVPNTRRYHFISEVARGGMGAILKVWDNDLRRSLAMKVILSKREMGTYGTSATEDDKSLKRFLEEAQVTGQLDHPGIVPVHEMGLDEEGHVYFTMRLVRGQDLRAIFELVQEEKEGWNRTRALGVLLKACEAMAYAHSKGVIHRDLKPANIMVGRYGQVYVMDWGLAKVLGQGDTRDLGVDEAAMEVSSAGPLLTMDGDVVGTPAYMSPEQARGEVHRMDQRTDVYAMGAMLYHLLAERMPYTRDRVGIDGCTVWRWLLDGPPQPLHELASDVPAELDAICEKAMARDREGRYANMLEMADDLRAYLENRVVSAYRTGPAAEFCKWVGRNRALASTIALAIFLLLGGAVASALVLAAKNEEITVARDDAQRAAVQAETINDFLVKDMLLASTPESAMGQEITVNDVLDNASRRVATGLGGKGEVEAAVQHTLGEAFWKLGRHEEAVDHLGTAFDLRREMLGKEHRDTLTSMCALGWALFSSGDFEQGERLIGEGFEARKRTLGDEDPDTLQSVDLIAEMLYRKGHPEKAEPLLRENLDRWQRRAGSDNALTMGTLHRLTSAVKAQGRLDEAEALMQEALTRMRRVLSDDHPDTINAVNDMACLLHDMGRLEEAEKYYEEALEGAVRVYGEDHFMHSVALNNMGTLIQDRSEYESRPELLKQAELHLRKSLDIRRRIYPEDHPLVATGLHNLGGLMLKRGRLEESEKLVREAFRIRMRKLGPDHDETIVSLYGLAVILEAQGKSGEAETSFREVITALDRSLSPGHWQRGSLRRGLGELLLKQGRYAEAEEIYLESYSILTAAVGDRHELTRAVMRSLVETLSALGRNDEAEQWRKKLDDSSGT